MTISHEYVLETFSLMPLKTKEYLAATTNEISDQVFKHYKQTTFFASIK